MPLSPPRAAIDSRVQIVAIVGHALLLFGLVLELVRRRRLVERYALLWMSAAVALLVLAVWRDLLEHRRPTASASRCPPNALFLVAFGVVFVLLLHFSVATSRLGEETKILAQEVGAARRASCAARCAARTAAQTGGAAGRAEPRARRAARGPATSRRAAPSAAAARRPRRPRYGEERSAVSAAANSAGADRAPAPGSRAARAAARGSAARAPSPHARELLAPPAARDRDRDQRELGREQRRREQREQRRRVGPQDRRPAVALQLAPLRGALGELVVVVDASPRARSRAARRRAAAAARGRRPRRRGRSSSGKPARLAPGVEADREAGAGGEADLARRERRAAAGSSRPAPPAHASPVKWTTPPSVLTTRPRLGGDEPHPRRPAAAVGGRARGSRRRSPAPRRRRG